MAEAVAEAIAESGKLIVEAGTGTECLKAADSQGPFALILLDVNLPDMDGYSVCRAIRHVDKKVPIVFVTANEGEELDVPDLPSPGARIPKPFTDEQLERTLRHDQQAVLFLNRRGFVCNYPQNITDLLVRDPAQA